MSVATSQPRVSVVVPTYNEKENVREFNRRLRPVVESLGGKVNVVFVDDNSPDGTASEIRSLMQESPDIHLIERPSKQGLGTAYLDGFKYVVDNFDPEIVIQIDADLQHPPEMVETLVRKVVAGEADVAIASRRAKGGSFKGLNARRRLISRGASRLSRTTLGLPVKDPTTGFKALSRSAIEKLLAHPPRSNGFIFQVESLYILKKNGFKMVEVPFTFEERAKGASKMGTGEIWEFFLSVLSIRFREY